MMSKHDAVVKHRQLHVKVSAMFCPNIVWRMVAPVCYGGIGPPLLYSRFARSRNYERHGGSGSRPGNQGCANLPDDRW